MIRVIVKLILLIITETSAQYFIEKYKKDTYNLHLFLGMCLYSLVGFLYLLLLNEGEKLAIANSLWNAGTGISVAIMGYFLFHQKITNKQIFGMIITIIGINFLQ